MCQNSLIEFIELSGVSSPALSTNAARSRGLGLAGGTFARCTRMVRGAGIRGSNTCEFPDRDLVQ